MLRTNKAYPEIVRIESSSRVPLARPIKRALYSARKAIMGSTLLARWAGT
jgi:hypothetical protein